MLLVEKELHVDGSEPVNMFIEGMSAGVWVWDMHTGVAWWSDEMYQLLGYAKGEVCIDRDSFISNILHPEDFNVMQDAAERLIDSRNSGRSELRMKHRTDGYLWFKCGGKMSFDGFGRPVKMYGSMINIHDRKMAEERLSMVIEGVEAGVWEWDIANERIWWSDKLYEMLGYDRDEIVIDTRDFLRQIVHPDELDAMQSALARYIRDQTSYRVELRIKHKTQGYLWYESSGKCRTNEHGQPVKMVGSMINCHERKMLEQRISHSEFILNETGRISKVGGWEIDLTGNKPYWSKATYDIHEMPYDYVPDLESAFNFFHDDYKQKLKDAVDRAVKYGEAYEVELKFITAKKRMIWVKSYGEPVYDKHGEVCKLRGVFMDIDEEKKNESDLKRSLEVLTRQNEQLSGFSHMLSHNLRNHAGSISLIARMLNESIETAERENLIANLFTVSQRLNGTLDEMSKALQQGDKTVSRELISFAELFNEIKEVLANTILSLNIQITSRFEVSHITYPRMYLESILMNLISNAIKYRKANAAPIIYINTSVDRESGRIVLECTDNGMGIDMEKHGTKLFSLYKTFHTNQDAHGVGLFLIRTQIESQGGQISVQSKPGVGSSFKVLF